MVVLWLAVGTLILAGSCRAPDPPGALVTLELAGEMPRPSFALLNWLDPQKFVFRGVRVPAFGDLPVRGLRLAQVSIEATGEGDKRRAIVRGLRDGQVVVEGALRVDLERGAQILVTVVLRQGRMPDGDGDGIPDEVDDCATVRDPSGGCRGPMVTGAEPPPVEIPDAGASTRPPPSTPPPPATAAADASPSTSSPDAPMGGPGLPVDARASEPPPPDRPTDLPRDLAPPDTRPLPVELASGLLAHMRLDEGQGTTTQDATGRGHTGTLVAGPTWTMGGFPGAQFANPFSLSFDGTSDFVELVPTGLPAANAATSWSLWVNYPVAPSSVPQHMLALTNAGSSARVIGFRGGRLGVWRFGGTFLADTTPPPPGWHHLVYTFDGTTHRLHVDGTLRSSSTTPPDTAGVTSARLGTFHGGVELFRGQMDDVRIWSRALNEAEIAALRAGRDR